VITATLSCAEVKITAKMPETGAKAMNVNVAVIVNNIRMISLPRNERRDTRIPKGVLNVFPSDVKN
jgi:hypothetical protein